MTFKEAIDIELDIIKTTLLQKNDKYGNSALDPIRIFSKSSVEEQLNVRIDDKLSRIARGNNNIIDDEDTILDLIGYLILKRTLKRINKT